MASGNPDESKLDTANSKTGAASATPPGAGSAGDAPDAGTAESAEIGRPGGILSRLNPLRLFRRNTAETFVSEGKEALENGSLAQATVAFQQALKMDPELTAAHRGLGRVFYKKGGKSNLETALKHYGEAIKRSPLEHDLYAVTAKIYDQMGKRKEATLERKKLVIVRALDADLRNPIANNNMGILFLQQGRMAEALDYFNRAVVADRKYDVGFRNLAAAYMQLAKEAADAEKKAEMIGKARESIQKALDIAAAVPTLLAQARILMMDGNLEDVLAVLERVDTMESANAEVQFMKKMTFEGLGRFEEARSAHEAYLAFRRQSGIVQAAAE